MRPMLALVVYTRFLPLLTTPTCPLPPSPAWRPSALLWDALWQAAEPAWVAGDESGGKGVRSGHISGAGEAEAGGGRGGGRGGRGGGRFDVPGMAAVLWATARAGRQPPNERLVTSAMTAATAAADFRFLGGDATAASLSTLAARHHSPDNCDAGRTSPQTSIASEAPDVPHPSASPHAQSPPPPPPASSTWKLVIRPSDLARLLWSSAKMGLPSAATSFFATAHKGEAVCTPEMRRDVRGKWREGEEV